MEDQQYSNSLIDTTDCLEAIGVFRFWKNFLFVIILVCLLLVQGTFWLMDLGYVSGEVEISAPVAAIERSTQVAVPVATAEEQTIEAAAKQVLGEANQVAGIQVEQPASEKVGFLIKFGYWSGVLRVVNFVLVFAVVFYCLVILFSLKISLLGRLGGINHISRAFFISLIMMILLLPWQKVFPGIVTGMMFTPTELAQAAKVTGEEGIFSAVFYYLRFCGYWLIVVFFVLFSLIRSGKWTKATLKRLEII